MIAQRTRDTQRIRNEPPPEKSASYEERPTFHTHGNRRGDAAGDLVPWDVLAIVPHRTRGRARRDQAFEER
jgi:hypothetical protein